MTAVEPAPALRCSQWARGAGLDPGGTAGTPGGFVVVDWPLPWPPDLGAVPQLADVVALAGANGLRLQGRVPALGRDPAVTVYRRPGPGPFTQWAVAEAGSGSGTGPEVTGALTALLGHSPAAGGSETRGAGEILLCTHGRRDVCCGSYGTTLFAGLTGTGPSVSGATVAGRPVRRTSHTGGHRFAPTIVVLPEGTAWAFADAELIRRVVTRSGPLDDVVPRYRGCTGLKSPGIQVLERAVLAEMGWPLLASARSGEELGDGGVRLRVVEPAGTESVWQAEVVAGRTLSVPDCGRPLDEARKTETERTVRALQRVR